MLPFYFSRISKFLRQKFPRWHRRAQANKIANATMSVKKHDQQNNLAFSDCFTLQNLCKFYLLYVPLDIPTMPGKFLKSQVDPQIQKSQTVEALNVNTPVNQSEKAVCASFRRRNNSSVLAPVKIWHQTVWHTVQNLVSNLWCQFLAMVSGACIVGLTVVMIYVHCEP